MKKKIYVRDLDWTLEPIDELTPEEKEFHDLVMREGVVVDDPVEIAKILGTEVGSSKVTSIRNRAHKNYLSAKKLKIS
ncbi:MAG: hypothetical protein EXR81_06055 [Gammaproteobacteria bacterium]|nr:hypothetical protein [Gammaproteobacteria bacterium]